MPIGHSGLYAIRPSIGSVFDGIDTNPTEPELLPDDEASLYFGKQTARARRKLARIDIMDKRSPKGNDFFEKMALIVRIATVPPLLASGLLAILYFFHDGVFADLGQLLVSLGLLAFLPLAAYPLSYAASEIRSKGREGQRRLAFALSLTGYVFSLIYGISFQVSGSLLLIYLGYCISVIALIVLNKVVKVRASGHACSVFGPLVLLVYFIGPEGIVPCAAVLLAVIWSSLYLGRHTAKELALGAASSSMAMAISIAILGSPR